jgi:formylglycine-generating enzyme required for sulfatase activity
MVHFSTFCIDSTEVTNGQYDAFLADNPSLGGQPAACSWNSTYLPGNGWTFDPSQADFPIANVDWCDAYAFCKWAGKRLCGKVGGGSVPFADFSGADNEHYLACSNGGSRIYPYGNTFDMNACNGLERQLGHTVATGTGCQGGVSGLFDMAGNVEEWQDGCDGNTGASDACLNGAGAFDYGTPPQGTRCDFADSDRRDAEFSDVGVRCCANPH